MSPETHVASEHAPASGDRHKHPMAVLLICGLVILGAAATVIYATVIKPPETRMTYNVVVALACFMASSVSGLLFATTNVNIRGTTGIFALTVGGPAALWLVALIVVSQILPVGATAIDVIAITRQVVTSQEHHDGWLPFKEWVNKLGTLSTIFEEDEELNLRLVLSGAYIRGDGHNKLTSPRIDTLFVYPPNVPGDACQGRTLKLQRVRGGHVDHVAHVFIASSATRPDGTVSYVLLDRDETGHVTSKRLSSQPAWVAASANPVDMFLIAEYCETLPTGDWLQIHVPKYVGADDFATVNIGIASARALSLSETKLWELRPATFSGDSVPFPALFKQFAGSAHRDIETLTDSLKDWLPDCERLATTSSGSEAGVFLSRILPHLRGNGKSPQYFASSPHVVSYRAETTRYSAVMTFKWSGQATPPKEIALSSRGGRR